MPYMCSNEVYICLNVARVRLFYYKDHSSIKWQMMAWQGIQQETLGILFVKSWAWDVYWHKWLEFLCPFPENLYDVFVNIRDDEAEHCKTMKACQTHGNLRSPHSYPVDGFEDMPGCMIPEANCEGIVDCIKKSLTPSQVKQKEEIWE